MNRNKISYGPAYTVSLVVLLTVSVIWLTPALAQSKKDKEETTPTASAAPVADSTKVVKRERITITDPTGNKRTYNSMDEVPEADRKKIADAGNKDEEHAVVVKKIITDGSKEEVIDIGKTINEAMAEVDWMQINKDINGAMGEVQSALREIDWEKINAETNTAMEESHKAMEESHKAMEEAKKKMAEIDWKKIDADTKKAMEEAKVAMVEAEEAMKESAKAMKAFPPTPPVPPARRTRPIPPRPPVVAIPPGGPGNSYERMLDRMDAEGLIDRDKKFKVEKKNDALYIDGNKQSPETYRKYGRFLSGESVSIKGNKGTLEIKVRN